MWFLLAMSCADKNDCAEEGAPSLILNFVDASGMEAIPDSVEWYHNGSAMGQISQLSSELSIGSELVGDFEVIVMASGYTQTFSYSVERTECQVSTVEDTIEILAESECDEMELPSVIISAIDLLGEPLLIDEVLYSIDDGESLEATCWNDCTEWIAGIEESGLFEIVGSYIDPSSGENLLERETVYVETGECNVETEEVVLAFQVFSSEPECGEMIDANWRSYFEEQVGCGDIALHAIMEGGFQQLTLQTSALLEEMSLNTPLTLDLTDENVALFLQFGANLDQIACNDAVEDVPEIDLEFVASTGSVTLTLHEYNGDTAVISAQVQNALLDNNLGCSTMLPEYLWSAVTVGWLPGK